MQKRDGRSSGPLRNVLVATPAFGARGRTQAWRRLEAAGLTLRDCRTAPVESEPFRTALAEADAVVVGNAPQVDDALLDRAPRLRWVAKLGAGLDNVDVEAASRRGVLVFHTPGANAEAVADYTFGLILALARHIVRADAEVRAGGWTKVPGLPIGGRTLGIVGLGAVGRAVAQRAAGFRMEVVAHEPFWPEAFAREAGIRRLALPELLARADVVTLHCPLTDETRGLIGEEELGRMKPTALLVNAARGGLVDEEALSRALSAGRLGGAALDTFAKEPPAGSPLLGPPNVLLSPHAAWFTTEALDRMNDDVAEQLLQVLRGEPPAHLVNRALLGAG